MKKLVIGLALACALAVIGSHKPVMAHDGCDDALAAYNWDTDNIQTWSDFEENDDFHIQFLIDMGETSGPEWNYWVGAYNEAETVITADFANADAQYTYMKQNQCPNLP